MSRQDKSESLHGTVNAYEPLFRKAGDEKWHRVPTSPYLTDELKVIGFPPPKSFGYVIRAAGYFGYSQAMGLAWQYMAHADNEGFVVEIGLCLRRLKFDFESDVEEETLIFPDKPLTERMKTFLDEDSA